VNATDPPTLALDRNQITLFQALEGARKPCLILYSGFEAGKRFDLDSGLLIIGRALDAPVRVDAPGISRRHAQLQVSDSEVLLQDLGSANGTYINDQPVTGPMPVKDGDLLRLGNVVLRFHGQRSLDALLHDRIYRLASVDAGTGAFNRRHLLETLTAEIERAPHSGRPLSVICYDLDQFKTVNDTYGHAAGDQVLAGSAQVVRGALRAGDVLGRLGGEEFAVVLPGTDRPAALELAERLRAALAAHHFEIKLTEAGGERTITHRQTVSLGVATLAPDQTDMVALMAEADRMLYAAKRAGRNRVGA
jgi:diguanylate cyclase (GGDEF)-like protein